MTDQTFYPTKKEYMSPSALDNWINSRSLFIKSYFEGIKGPETAAMTGGKKIHALIEAGIIQVKSIYDIHEEPIKIEIKPGRVFYGIPDSRLKAKKGVFTAFVDYKTGKEDPWGERLPSDIKMKATAYLVWKEAGCPKEVKGTIEYIPTEWDGSSKEIVPVDKADTVLHTISYLKPDLEAFEEIILKAMDEVNEEHEKWLQSSDKFVNQDDVAAYVELRAKKEALTKDIDKELKEIGDRIMGQLEFGGKTTYSSPAGTFYTTTRKTYEYPPTLAFKVGKKSMTLKEAEEVDTAAAAAKKNFELTNEPKTISKSIGFRVAKEK